MCIYMYDYILLYVTICYYTLLYNTVYITIYKAIRIHIYIYTYCYIYIYTYITDQDVDMRCYIVAAMMYHPVEHYTALQYISICMCHLGGDGITCLQLHVWGGLC